MSVNNSKYKIPILLGVTGHRDISKSQYPVIREQLAEHIKKRILLEYPHSPVKLLTPLADGADRLVAEIALQIGIPIIVPLPMPDHIYTTTFSGQDGSVERDTSIAEFKNLLSRAESSFSLPLVEGVTETGLMEFEEQRRSQYALVGAYMAKHSHILIALYDGKPSDAIGGTSQIVMYREKGEMNGLPLKVPTNVLGEELDFLRPDSIFDLQNTGIIWKVHVDRENSAIKKNEVRITEDLPEDKSHLIHFTRTLQKIGVYNRDVDEHLTAASPEGDLFEDVSEELHQQERLLINADTESADCLNRIRNAFRAADHLSIAFSNDHKAYFTVFCFIVGGIVVAELLYAHNWHPVGALSAYLVFLLIGYGIFRIHKERSVHSKYNEYRSLAEALRVQFFWRCAGLRSMAPDHYLNKHQGEMHWISASIKAIAFNNYVKSKDNVDFVFEAWIKDQVKFYHSRIIKLEETEKYQEFYSKVLYCSMFVLSLCGIYLHDFIEHAFLSFALGAIPVIFVLLEHKINFNAELEKIRSYKIYHKLFDKAKVKIEHYKNDKKMSQEIIYQVGCEALIENGDWLIVNRDKKAEAAKP